MTEYLNCIVAIIFNENHICKSFKMWFLSRFFFEYSTAHISKKCWEQRLKYGGAGVSGEAKVESVQLVENMSIKKTKKKQNEY